MAPNADKLRHRTFVNVPQTTLDNPATIRNSHDRVIQDETCLRPNEVAIDGTIYNLDTFDHPGGENIKIFGGNDVTVQYRMIHPYHTSKHLEKMEKVGKITNYKCEYKFDTEFEREIKREVFKIVHRGREFGTFGWFARAIFYTALFFYLQYLWIVAGSSWQLAIVYGISQALIGLNVQHDANHGAVSKNPFLNNLFGLGTDFIGGSKWLWMEQHWTHHTYTNHNVKDPDTYSAEPMILFRNYPLGHQKRQWYHSLQAFYFPLVMSGYWLSSVFNLDVLTLKQSGAVNSGLQMDNDFITSRRKYAIALRVIYIYCNIICPFRVKGFTFGTLFEVLLMGAAGSFFLAMLFALSHNFEECDRDPTELARKSGEPVCWYKAQVETSCTYGGAIAGYITGGLNFQIEHHLFPRMSSSWYPYIAPKVREICKKHGVNYAYYPYVWQNFLATIKYVNDVGTGALWTAMANPFSGRA